MADGAGVGSWAMRFLRFLTHGPFPIPWQTSSSPRGAGIQQWQATHRQKAGPEQSPARLADARSAIAEAKQDRHLALTWRLLLPAWLPRASHAPRRPFVGLLHLDRHGRTSRGREGDGPGSAPRPCLPQACNFASEFMEESCIFFRVFSGLAKASKGNPRAHSEPLQELCHHLFACAIRQILGCEFPDSPAELQVSTKSTGSFM